MSGFDGSTVTALLKHCSCGRAPALNMQMSLQEQRYPEVMRYEEKARGFPGAPARCVHCMPGPGRGKRAL